MEVDTDSLRKRSPFLGTALQLQSDEQTCLHYISHVFHIDTVKHSDCPLEIRLSVLAYTAIIFKASCLSRCSPKAVNGDVANTAQYHQV